MSVQKCECVLHTFDVAGMRQCDVQPRAYIYSLMTFMLRIAILGVDILDSMQRVIFHLGVAKTLELARTSSLKILLSIDFRGDFDYKIRPVTFDDPV